MVIIVLLEGMVQFLIYDDGFNILGDVYLDNFFDYYLLKFLFCFRVMLLFVKVGLVRSIGRKKRKVENEE